MREWSVLATSVEGRREALLASLRRLGTFWRAGYRNVVVGRVENQQEFLEAVQERLTTEMLLESSLTKIVPVERVAPFHPDQLAETVIEMLGPHAGRIAGQRFYVRLERRGLKGIVHTPTVERVVGAALVEAGTALGGTPTVAFQDPDTIVAIETTGQTVGVGLLPRDLRRTFPFVKVS
jgi:tRNA(Ser,Leu) C12 N-acetylase TAN1